MKFYFWDVCSDELFWDGGVTDIKGEYMNMHSSIAGNLSPASHNNPLFKLADFSFTVQLGNINKSV